MGYALVLTNVFYFFYTNFELKYFIMDFEVLSPFRYGKRLATLSELANTVYYTGIILVMGSASERRRYNVTSSFIGWAHTQSNPCYTLVKLRHISHSDKNIIAKKSVTEMLNIPQAVGILAALRHTMNIKSLIHGKLQQMDTNNVLQW